MTYRENEMPEFSAKGKLGDGARYRCRKCGEQNVIEFNSARIVTRNPHTGADRDPRDIASDPEGKLMVNPSKPLLAALGDGQGATDESVASRERELSFQAFQTIRPPMTRIAGVSPGVLERAAKRSLAAPSTVTFGTDVEASSRNLIMSDAVLLRTVAKSASNLSREARAQLLAIAEGIGG